MVIPIQWPVTCPRREPRSTKPLETPPWAAARGQDLALGPARLERLQEHPEALRVDADALANRVELEVALHGARVVELDVPADELGRIGERAVVAHGHHVVEPVDADPLAAQP